MSWNNNNNDNNNNNCIAYAKWTLDLNFQTHKRVNVLSKTNNDAYVLLFTDVLPKGKWVSQKFLNKYQTVSNYSAESVPLLPW
jgi:hypothetical protein